MLQIVNLFSRGSKKKFSRFFKLMLILTDVLFIKRNGEKMDVRRIGLAGFLTLSSVNCATSGTTQTPMKQAAIVQTGNIRAAQNEAAIGVCTDGALRSLNAALMASPETDAIERRIFEGALLNASQQCVDNAGNKFAEGVLVLGSDSQKKAGAAIESVQKEVSMAICSDKITGHVDELLGDAKVGSSARETFTKALLDVAGQCADNLKGKFQGGILRVDTDAWKNYLAVLKREIRK